MNNNISIRFVEWVSKNGYQLEDIHSQYERDRCDGTYSPIYTDEFGNDTFIASKWTKHGPISEIMADNDNTELKWCLDNSKTSEELFNEFLESEK